MAKANVKHVRNPKWRYFVTGSGQLIQGTINFLVVKDPAEFKAAQTAATLLAGLGQYGLFSTARNQPTTFMTPFLKSRQSYESSDTKQHLPQLGPRTEKRDSSPACWGSYLKWTP